MEMGQGACLAQGGKYRRPSGAPVHAHEGVRVTKARSIR